ncbi:GNAT family N-acetyltransferase [Thermoactinomyces mirandus]|uniref:GNAT family N-acetyltransferase n=1 Tax=Thermoactinomyces mirandus TaxID=2756294 RepID=A0A7W2AQ97_9BACL|nr:GNAT family protein [Thermoactinomyces mirandus]MBA4601072.1 GNAT family N-acetyltransferase [Thermoactinomyces mirandus]
MVQLLPFTEQDIERLISWIDTPDLLLQWAGPVFTFPLDRVQVLNHLNSANDKFPKSLIFKAMDDHRNKTVGHIELSRIDQLNQSASLARVFIAPACRGNGYGQEMVKKALEIGFNKLQLHRIDLRVFDFNKQAIKCYEKCGFKKEGLLRDARKCGNGYWSLYQMSILEQEWFK